MEYCRAVDRDERSDHDLYARGRVYRGGNELVAGDVHDPAWQLHRVDPDDFECTCRNKIRSFISGSVPGVVWDKRREYSGDIAGDRCLRMVWDSDLDRRNGDRALCDGNLVRVGRVLTSMICGNPLHLWFAFFWLFGSFRFSSLLKGIEGIKLLETWSAPLLLLAVWFCWFGQLRTRADLGKFCSNVTVLQKQSSRFLDDLSGSFDGFGRLLGDVKFKYS